jgi:hypothetical protein
MFTKATTAAAVLVLLNTGSACLARDGGPHAIDVQRLCQANTDALGTVFAGDNLPTMDTCVADEQAARAELVTNWATYPALVKTQCVKPQEYLPGYVEWLTCIEMTRDVLDPRKRPAGDATIGSGAGREPSSGQADPRPRPGTRKSEDSASQRSGSRRPRD